MGICRLSGKSNISGFVYAGSLTPGGEDGATPTSVSVVVVLNK